MAPAVLAARASSQAFRSHAGMTSGLSWGTLRFVAAHDVRVPMIDTPVARAEHEARITGNKKQHMGRSRCGFASKIHAVVDANGLPLRCSRSTSQLQRRTAEVENAAAADS
jgi:hypothetical protein